MSNLQCIYTPLRGEKKQCILKAVTPWGICDKHVNTMFSKNAKKLYENKKDGVEDPSLQDGSEKVNKEIVKPEKVNKEIVKPEKVNKKKEGETIIKVFSNDFGNFEHKKTGIVFDVNSKKAYGVQKQNGTVVPLTKYHIDLCEKNNWPYQTSPYEEESEEEEEDDEKEESEEEEEDDEKEEESDEEEDEEEESDEEEEKEEECDEKEEGCSQESGENEEV